MTTELKEPTKETALIPHLTCHNAAEAVEFYGKAFGAEPISVLRMPDGQVMHAALQVGGAIFYLVDEFPDYGRLGPKGLGGSSVTLHLQVADCDAVFARAIDAGCEPRMPLEDMFWGDRYGMVIDPYGHLWSMATTLRRVSPEEMQQAMEAFCTEENHAG